MLYSIICSQEKDVGGSAKWTNPLHMWSKYVHIFPNHTLIILNKQCSAVKGLGSVARDYEVASSTPVYT